MLLPTKLLIAILGGILGLIMGFFAEDSSLMGVVQNGGLTLEDILFNRVQLLDVNFFNFTGDPSSTSYMIKENVAIWYTSIRNIAIVVLAIIAVYIGIRMAISTVAEDKAKYKTMLMDWLTSLALVFILQYIMIFTISINNAFIDVLSKGLGNGQNSDLVDTFLTQAITNISFTTGMASAIIYLLFQGITFIFLLSYIKRMITIAFLIVISPLVTITYSIDKMGDGKSQALNVWLKEFVYNILIQPFHCVSYLVLATTALAQFEKTGWSGGAGLAQAIIAIAILVFIYSAEKIVKHIFHFESESMGETIAGAAIAGAVLGKVTSGAKKAAGAAGVVKNYTNGTPNGPNGPGGPGGPNAPQPTTPQTQNANSQNQTPIDPTNSPSNTPSAQLAAASISSQASTQASQNTNNAGGASNYKRVNEGRRTVLNSLVALNARAAGAIALGTLGLATGDPKAMITGGMSGYGMGAGYSEANKTRMRKHDMARAVKRYEAANQGMSQEDVINNALDFADGTKIAQTEEEIMLRDAMQQLQLQYTRNGLDEKKVIKQSRQIIKDIDGGLVTEYSAAQRYAGKIRTKMDDMKDAQSQRRNTSQPKRRGRRRGEQPTSFSSLLPDDEQNS